MTRQEDQKFLNRVANQIVNHGDLTRLGVELGVSEESIRRAIQDSASDMWLAAFWVETRCYNNIHVAGNLHSGSKMYIELKCALNKFDISVPGYTDKVD